MHLGIIVEETCSIINSQINFNALEMKALEEYGFEHSLVVDEKIQNSLNCSRFDPLVEEDGLKSCNAIIAITQEKLKALSSLQVDFSKDIIDFEIHRKIKGVLLAGIFARNYFDRLGELIKKRKLKDSILSEDKFSFLLSVIIKPNNVKISVLSAIPNVVNSLISQFENLLPQLNQANIYSVDPKGLFQEIHETVSHKFSYEALLALENIKKLTEGKLHIETKNSIQINTIEFIALLISNSNDNNMETAEKAFQSLKIIYELCCEQENLSSLDKYKSLLIYCIAKLKKNYNADTKGQFDNFLKLGENGKVVDKKSYQTLLSARDHIKGFEEEEIIFSRLIQSPVEFPLVFIVSEKQENQEQEVQDNQRTHVDSDSIVYFKYFSDASPSQSENLLLVKDNFNDQDSHKILERLKKLENEMLDRLVELYYLIQEDQALKVEDVSIAEIEKFLLKHLPGVYDGTNRDKKLYKEIIFEINTAFKHIEKCNLISPSIDALKRNVNRILKNLENFAEVVGLNSTIAYLLTLKQTEISNLVPLNHSGKKVQKNNTLMPDNNQRMFEIGNYLAHNLTKIDHPEIRLKALLNELNQDQNSISNSNASSQALKLIYCLQILAFLKTDYDHNQGDSSVLISSASLILEQILPYLDERLEERLNDSPYFNGYAELLRQAFLKLIIIIDRDCVEFPHQKRENFPRKNAKNKSKIKKNKNEQQPNLLRKSMGENAVLVWVNKHKKLIQIPIKEKKHPWFNSLNSVPKTATGQFLNTRKRNKDQKKNNPKIQMENNRKNFNKRKKQEEQHKKIEEEKKKLGKKQEKADNNKSQNALIEAKKGTPEKSAKPKAGKPKHHINKQKKKNIKENKGKEEIKKEATPKKSDTLGAQQEASILSESKKPVLLLKNSPSLQSELAKDSQTFFAQPSQFKDGRAEYRLQSSIKENFLENIDSNASTDYEKKEALINQHSTDGSGYQRQQISHSESDQAEIEHVSLQESRQKDVQTLKEQIQTCENQIQTLQIQMNQINDQSIETQSTEKQIPLDLYKNLVDSYQSLLKEYSQVINERNSFQEIALQKACESNFQFFLRTNGFYLNGSFYPPQVPYFSNTNDSHVNHYEPNFFKEVTSEEEKIEHLEASDQFIQPEKS